MDNKRHFLITENIKQATEAHLTNGSGHVNTKKRTAASGYGKLREQILIQTATEPTALSASANTAAASAFWKDKY